MERPVFDVLRRDTPKAPPPPPLDAVRIARYGVWFADTGGLEEVSMRAVASALGVSAPALYRHVDGREGLLAFMVDEVLAEARVSALIFDRALDAGWREAIGEVARETCRACQAHPWVVGLPWLARLGPNGRAHAEQLIAGLGPLGFGAAARREAMHLVDAYVLGYVVRWGADNDAFEWGLAVLLDGLAARGRHGGRRPGGARRVSPPR